ncbi:2Fe-2S iron-sulfur cluster binding domain-containing protein [Xenorhabdus budapestensis]|uniref:2Fe-2S iron-sulfur cluster binding domain-containing protein n=1 Tax=Xenorhabdus budapestensis TaxID=290110 RepID=A0ABX7VG94_XENBU|nr:FAD-binding oxidoreductase [Xenorhabdus budapestensis]QTL39791.1 2Fe-2S iron-sulfur cluster binding domain-containing protein [Xenorhabdus budapestensis]
MTTIVKLSPSQITFRAIKSKTILESALESDVVLEYSCKSGSCGMCESVLITGEVSDKQENIYKAGQRFLACQCKPTSDELTIEAEYYPELAEIMQKIVPCKVSSTDITADEYIIIKFRLPPSASFAFLPGQYINLHYQGIVRSYSIANSNAQDGIELHIRRVNRGAMSGLLFNNLSTNTLMRLEGPLGTFFVREDIRPIIFLAGGTGFAPVKSMVEKLIQQDSKRDIHIYWGMHNGSGFYSDLPMEWANKYENIHYVPVVSGEDSLWSGRKGFVHNAVVEDYHNLSTFAVYACGSPTMIAAAKADFIKKGLSGKHFFSDAFTESK